ncbi:MAG: PEP/pyruvate-binding domain-containing protein [Planctomycetota bacterium]
MDAVSEGVESEPRARPQWVLQLTDPRAACSNTAGGKAARLAELAREGFVVPRGFCVTTAAYEHVLQTTGLGTLVRMELGRKPIDTMRWEEIWDAALRIRHAFLGAELPRDLEEAICGPLGEFDGVRSFAVRSSAPSEDASAHSFAGLHETILDVVGERALLKAVRAVWASLWSDAALLYRRELALDVASSRMAVLVQELVEDRPSGVVFGCDPRAPKAPRILVEAVPGRCADLVDGLVDPDHWILERDTGKVVFSRRGSRGTSVESLLSATDLVHLGQTVLRVERRFGWPADLEWTGRPPGTTVLQARPVQPAKVDPDADAQDKRPWYLTLRPSDPKLRELKKRVVETLIPELDAAGARLATEDLAALGDAALALAIEERIELAEHWRRVYWDDFIPFAHGVRRLAIYFNDAVQPADPYAFIGLLHGEELLASKRNRAVAELAARLRANPALREAVRRVESAPTKPAGTWADARVALSRVEGGASLVSDLQALCSAHLDIAYRGTRLSDHPELLLGMVAEWASSDRPKQADTTRGSGVRDELERELFEAVGPERREEAAAFLELGRVSWRLRDDDNLLLGRVEAQLLRAVGEAERRLDVDPRSDARSPGPIEARARWLSLSLRDRNWLLSPGPSPPGSKIGAESARPIAPSSRGAVRPRQLVGQPAAPGVATGRARAVRGPDDLSQFHAGEVLVCDAIQPTMTHVVPLACAIVERRGGMLIHGTIIARELGIPCVNGIPDAAALINDGDFVTVDGYLGVVTIGPPEFDRERSTFPLRGTDT